MNRFKQRQQLEEYYVLVLFFKNQKAVVMFDEDVLSLYCLIKG